MANNLYRFTPRRPDTALPEAVIEAESQTTLTIDSYYDDSEDTTYTYCDFSILRVCRFSSLKNLSVNVPAEMTDFSVFTYIGTLEGLDISVIGHSDKFSEQTIYVDLPDNIKKFMIRKLTNVYRMYKNIHYGCHHQNPQPTITTYGHERTSSCAETVVKTSHCRKIIPIAINSKKLEELDTNYNIINLSELQSLSVLRLKNQKFRSDSFTAFLPLLTELCITETQLSAIPDLTKQIKLRKVTFQNCSIKTIPESFMPLFAKLDEIDLSQNELTKVVIPVGNRAMVNLCYNYIINISKPQTSGTTGLVSVENNPMTGLDYD